jgi:nitroreductase
MAEIEPRDAPDDVMPDGDPDEASTRHGDGLSEEDILSWVRAAVAAPSLHNSQPWRFGVRDDGVDVYVDRRRQLEVVDPSGREMLISVGAAVLNLRVAVRQRGWVPVWRIWPEAGQPDLVARVTAGPAASPNPAVDALAAAIPRRHTNRRPFERVVVAADVLEELTETAALEGAALTVADAAARNAIFSLVRTAEQRLRSQGRYRAELADWTRPAPGRRDGVPPQAFGPWAALETLPLRDFGLTQPQLHRRAERFEPYPLILVLCTSGDSADQWVLAGQALQRVLLVATVRGLAATPMSQPLEIPALRELITDTRTGRWAQVVLRVGYGPPAAATPRRPLAEVLLGPP